MCVSVCLSLSVSVSVCLCLSLSLSLSVSVCLCLSLSVSLSLSLSLSWPSVRCSALPFRPLPLPLQAMRSQLYFLSPSDPRLPVTDRKQKGAAVASGKKSIECQVHPSWLILQAVVLYCTCNPMNNALQRLAVHTSLPSFTSSSAPLSTSLPFSPPPPSPAHLYLPHLSAISLHPSLITLISSLPSYPPFPPSCLSPPCPPYLLPLQLNPPPSSLHPPSPPPPLGPSQVATVAILLL